MCGDFLSNLGSSVGDFLGSAGSAIGQGASAVGQGLYDAAGAVGGGIGDAAGAVGQGVSDAASYVGQQATGAGQGIYDLFSGSGGSAGGLDVSGAGGIQGAIPDFGATSSNVGAALPSGTQALSDYTSGFSAGGGSVAQNALGSTPNDWYWNADALPGATDSSVVDAIRNAPDATTSLLSAPGPLEGVTTANASSALAGAPAGAPTAASGASIPGYDGGLSVNAGTGAASAPGIVGQASNYISDAYKGSLASDLYGAGKNLVPSGDTMKGLAGLGSIGSLAYQALSPPQTAAQKAAAITATPLGQQQLTNAQNLGTASQALLAPSTTGVLPAGLQSGIDAQVAAAKQAIKGHYASLGMSGSSAEMQDMAAADAKAQEQKATLAQQMAQTGIAAAGGSSQDYAALSKQVLAEDAAFSNALAALSGTLQGNRGTTAASA